MGTVNLSRSELQLARGRIRPMFMRYAMPSYFTAIDRPDLSLLVAVLRGLVVLAPLILLLPKLWGIDGIWIKTPIAELITAIVAVALLIKHSKHFNI